MFAPSGEESSEIYRLPHPEALFLIKANCAGGILNLLIFHCLQAGKAMTSKGRSVKASFEGVIRFGETKKADNRSIGKITKDGKTIWFQIQTEQQDAPVLNEEQAKLL